MAVVATAHGLTIGVLDAGPLTQGVIETLSSESGVTVKVIEELNGETLTGVDVIVIAGEYDPDTDREVVREAARNGAGVFFINRTVCDGRTFPEIVWEQAGDELDVAEVPVILKPVKAHPITEGIPADGFRRLHWKHAYTFPQDDRFVLVEDWHGGDEFTGDRLRGTQLRWAPYSGGHAVLVAAPFGKGRVVYCGACFGINLGDRPVQVQGDERTLLMNSVRWLAQETPLDLPEAVRTDVPSRYRHVHGNPEFKVGAVQTKQGAGDADASDPPVYVRTSEDGSIAEVFTETFRILVAVEDGRPTIQSVQILDRGWHHTWDGVERASLSAPLLRVAGSLRPFEALPYKLDHERGLGLPMPGSEVKAVAYPGGVEVQVGDGRLLVSHTGHVTAEGFEGPARFAAWMFDGYAREDGFVPESSSYDFPETDTAWLWAVKKDRYAIGGNFRLTGRMGETGLAPGLEREAEFAGGTLVLTTNTDDLGDPEGAVVADEGPLCLARRTATLRSLWRMRGTEDFTSPLPEPVEIYADELTPSPKVHSWRVAGDEGLLIAAQPGDIAARSLPDAALTKATESLDPFNEDTGTVWRRLFVASADEKPMPGTRDIVIEALDDAGRCVMQVPVSVRVQLSVPMGIFTYSSQWIEQEARTPSDQWPKLMRDIGLANLDYIIHVAVLGDEQENPANVENRLKRYGLWWLGDVGRPGVAYIKAERTPEARAEMERKYAEVFEAFGSEPNILGWMLSEELPSGKVENGVVPPGYADANLFHELFTELDPNRPSINLISVYFTPYETATEHIKSDLFSWDPYGKGTGHALEATEKVRTQWRDVRNSPMWITLRCCGPRYSDLNDHWLDIRRRSIAAYKGGVDGINYFMYSHWLSNMEQFTFYAVMPGSQGPIASLRRQVLSDVCDDIALLSTAEYLLQTGGADVEKLRDTFDTALDLGVEGHFHQMRTLLNEVIAKRTH
ncbi:MAG: hypothetical protein GY851_08880 [bacterium]|nr:hypothetical protein [bacterium]